MPQEISVSYLAIKSKVYKLIEAVVAGEKTEEEVQESVCRWWALIHPSDRPVAKKYLLTVLERSGSALDAIRDGLTSSNGCNPKYASSPSASLRELERMVKEDSVTSTV
jgi:hypothetical protein